MDQANAVGPTSIEGNFSSCCMHSSSCDCLLLTRSTMRDFIPTHLWRSVVCVFVLVTTMSHAKTAEQIEMLFGDRLTLGQETIYGVHAGAVMSIYKIVPKVSCFKMAQLCQLFSKYEQKTRFCKGLVHAHRQATCTSCLLYTSPSPRDS